MRESVQSPFGRRRIWWEILATPAWRWLVTVPVAILGALQLIRDEFLAPETATKYKLPKLFPDISWHWWIIILLCLVLAILTESAYRAITAREDKLSLHKQNSVRIEILSVVFDPNGPTEMYVDFKVPV